MADSIRVMPPDGREDEGGKVLRLVPKELKEGGGGPHDPDMEKRLAAVEVAVKDIKDILTRFEPSIAKIDGMRMDLAELKGRVSQLPGTLQMVGFVLAVLAIAGVTQWFAPRPAQVQPPPSQQSSKPNP